MRRDPTKGGKPLPPTDAVHDYHHHHHHHKEQNQRQTIYILRSRLLADISAQVDIVADMRPLADGNPNPRLQNASTRYQSMFIQWIDKYLNLAKSRMAAYVLTLERHSAMNATREWEECIIHLAFPPTWNPTTFTNLADAIHQYIVNSVLKELFVLMFTSSDPLTADKIALADDAYREIKHCCVSKRPGTNQKPLHPF